MTTKYFQRFWKIWHFLSSSKAKFNERNQFDKIFCKVIAGCWGCSQAKLKVEKDRLMAKLKKGVTW